MPFVIRHDSQLARLADLGANAGLYQTGQDQFRNGLALAANDRADRAQGLGAMQTILADQRQRDITAANNAARIGLQDERQRDALELEDLRQRGRTGLLDARGIQRMQELDARQRFDAGQNLLRRDTQIGLAGLRDATQRRGQDLLNADRDAGRQQDAAQFQQRMQAQVQQQQHRAAMAQARQQAAARAQSDARLNAQVKLRIAELERQARMIDGWIDQGSTDANLIPRLGQINDEIAALIMGGGPIPVPATQPAGGAAGGGGLDAQTMQTGQPVQVQTEQQYQSLPPGTPYIAPDGSLRVKR